MDKTTIEQWVNTYTDIQKEANAMKNIYCRIQREILGANDDSDFLDFVGMQYGELYFCGEEYGKFQYYERHEFYLPISCLYDPNWENEEIEKARQKKYEKEVEAFQSQQREIDQEKFQLARLKAKYPNS